MFRTFAFLTPVLAIVSDFFVWLARWTLESLGTLEPRKSVLEDDFEEEEEKEENEQLDGLENGVDERVSIIPV